MAAGQTCRLWHRASRHIAFRKKEFITFTKNTIQNGDLIQALIQKNEFYNFNNYRFVEVDMENLPEEFWARSGEYIKHLELKECDIREKTFLNIINSCTDLESLSVTNCKELFMSASFADEVKNSRLKTLDKLNALNLANNRYLTDALFWRFTYAIQNLQELNLSDCPITFHTGLHKRFYPPNSIKDGETYPPSESILTFPYIKKFIETNSNKINNIIFNNTLIDGNALKTISELANIKLKKLSLSSCDQLNSQGIISMTKIQNTLVNLDLSSCTRLNNEALESICKNLTNLESLIISKCSKITNEGVVHLAVVEKLKFLDIARCPYVTSDGILNGICKIKDSKMISLNISSLELDESVIIAIAENFKNLRILNMSNCSSVTDTSIQAIFKHLTLLIALFIKGCKSLSDAALTGMGMGKSAESTSASPVPARINTDNSDKFLRISLQSRAEREIVQDAHRKNNIRVVCENYSEAIIGGFSLVRLKSLEHLDLCGCNNITDVSLTYAFHSKALKSLYLSDCQQVTHEGLKYLAENCPCIEKLELNNCYNLSDEGIRVIATNLKRLKYLYLRVSFILFNRYLFIRLFVFLIDFQSCTLLTNETVNIIKSHCTSLKTLDILSCRNISPEVANELYSLPTLHTLHISKPGPYMNDFRMPIAFGRRDF